MKLNSFKIENLRGEVAFDFSKKPYCKIQYIKFAVHYKIEKGIRMQYFTEWVNYVSGEPVLERDKNKSYMLNNNIKRLEYLAHLSIYNVDDLFNAIADKLDHILKIKD